MSGRLCSVKGAVKLLLVVILAWSGCSSGGDGDVGSGRYFAVIAGVSLYQISRFNLNFADDDAVDFFNTLNTGNNWDPGRMIMLLNSQATKAAIRDAIFATASRMGPDDFFVFYFSGHGTFGPDFPPADEVDGLDEFLVPHDALEFSYANDIRDDELENWLLSVPGSNVNAIFDSSFSGGMFKMVGQVKSITRPWHQERAIQSRPDGILKDLRRPGYVVMTASDDNESPVETPTLSNGVYTYYLVEGLQGPANNGGNFISSEAAHTYATPRSTAFYGGMHPQILDMHPGQYKLLIR